MAFPKDVHMWPSTGMRFEYREIFDPVPFIQPPPALNYGSPCRNHGFCCLFFCLEASSAAGECDKSIWLAFDTPRLETSLSPILAIWASPSLALDRSRNLTEMRASHDRLFTAKHRGFGLAALSGASRRQQVQVLPPHFFSFCSTPG